IKALINMGVMANQSQIIDADTAELIINEFGHTAKRVAESDVEEILNLEETQQALSMQARAPIVTVMGHVDHGKTSLLDRLRKTNVVAGEQGAITQHIGAYQIKWKDGQAITFLDTPGHAAFTAMRSRGAELTDIIVLVIAADDGVQPQTIEAIQHARATDVPIIVAINKCDHERADPKRISTELLSHEIVLESMGGTIQAFEISAKDGTNIDALIEGILLQAEIMELQAPIDGPARGVVVEARQERGRGAVITILLQSGTLQQGDIFVSGCESGRIRGISDHNGKTQKNARPAEPIEIIGAQGIPTAGDDFAVVSSTAQATQISEYRKRKRQELQASKAKRGSLDQLFSQIKDGTAQDLPIILKADTHGSLEAITTACEKMSDDEVRINVALGAVGGIAESDVILAETIGGFVVGFNVRANAEAREKAQGASIDIRYYGIIYELLEDLRGMLSKMLKPEIREEQIGYAEVREVFDIGKRGKAAGCFVTEGILRRSAHVRLLRDDVVIYNGELRQLRRFKEEVNEVANGYECGMSLANFADIKPKDVVECYEVIETAREVTL
ncbi:MAG: translation initiation factor IF-2, partial [Pseudomonadota bacterium]